MSGTELGNSAAQVPSSFLQVLNGIFLMPSPQLVLERLPHQITSNWLRGTSNYIFNDLDRLYPTLGVVRGRVDLITHGILNGTAGPVLVGNSGID